MGQTGRSVSGARDCDGLSGLHAFPQALPGLNAPWDAQCQGTRVTNGVMVNADKPTTVGFASGTCERTVMRISWGGPPWPGSGCIVLKGIPHLDTLSRNCVLWAPSNLWQWMIHSGLDKSHAASCLPIIVIGWNVCVGHAYRHAHGFICLRMRGEHRQGITNLEHA